VTGEPAIAEEQKGTSLWPMWVLALVVMIDQVDQNILRGAASPIQHAFHLNDFEVGVLLSCYTVANGIVSVPAGYLADRWVRRRGIAITLVIWSALTALTAAAFDFGALVAVRTALGAGEAMSEPSASSLLADLYPQARRGLAFATQQCLSFVGFGLGLGLGGVVASQLGWRAAFLIVGAPGVTISFFVWRLREPARGAVDRGEEAGLASVAAESHGLSQMWAHLFQGFKTVMGIRTLRHALVGVSALLFTVTAAASALPQFYEHQLGRGTGEAAALTGLLIVLAGVPGVFVGGRLADKVALRYRGGRIALPAICLLSGEAVFVLSFIHLPFVAVYLLELAGTFLVTVAVPPLKAGLSDALPAEIRGTGFAAFNIVSVIAGQAAASVIVFSIAGALGNDYRTALLVVSPGVAAGALVLWHARRYLDEDVARAKAPRALPG
jgi:MFS family permease